MMLMHSVWVETVTTANTRYNELVSNVAPLPAKKKGIVIKITWQSPLQVVSSIKIEQACVTLHL